MASDDGISPQAKAANVRSSASMAAMCCHGPLPKHGFVRTRPWRVLARPDAATVRLAVNTNSGPTSWSSMAALHTYVRVADIVGCTLHGLGQSRYGKRPAIPSLTSRN